MFILEDPVPQEAIRAKLAPESSCVR
jgi:hypothetical protein